MVLLAIAGASLFAAPAANAQSVMIIVTHAGTPEGAAPLRAAAIEALAERGARLIPIPDSEPCEEAACAARLAAQAGADATLLIAVSGPAQVELVAAPPEGEPRVLREEVADAEFARAVGALVERFLAEAGEPATGFVMVDSVPPGAQVAIDGAPAGEAPLRRSVTTGRHEVSVSQSGEPARRETVEVRPGEETAVTIDFGATPDGVEPDPAPGPPARTEPSPFNWVIGGALAVGGVLALISPLQTLARDGQCEEAIENVGCLEQVHVGPQTAVLLGVGIAALAAAVIVDATAPIRVQVSVGEDGARAAVGGRF